MRVTTGSIPGGWGLRARRLTATLFFTSQRKVEMPKYLITIETEKTLDLKHTDVSVLLTQFDAHGLVTGRDKYSRADIEEVEEVEEVEYPEFDPDLEDDDLLEF
jgi:hypothetical protein